MRAPVAVVVVDEPAAVVAEDGIVQDADQQAASQPPTRATPARSDQDGRAGIDQLEAADTATWRLRSGARAAGRRRSAAAARRSDERLVARVRARQRRAFEVVFDRHYRGILAFCRHMLGSREEAEDAVQHTFIAAHRDASSTTTPIRLKAWLYTIARNRCLSILRARPRAAAELDDEAPTARPRRPRSSSAPTARAPRRPRAAARRPARGARALRARRPLARRGRRASSGARRRR